MLAWNAADGKLFAGNAANQPVVVNQSHKSAHRPTFTIPAVRIVRASGPALTTGVEQHKIEGVAVQMTTPAKTVADCFRYRDTVGTDVAVEALRDCLRKRKATPSDIFEMAKVDRVARVRRPYLEALA